MTPATQTPFHKKLRLKRVLVRLGPGGRRITSLHDELDGLLAIEESRFLYTAPRDARTIVEIGSYRGKSCALMALGAPDAQITCIDPHIWQQFSRGADPSDHDIFMQTIRGVGVADRVSHIREKSQDARPSWPDDRRIDFLWIDGDHTYEGVSDDFAQWGPLLNPGGTIAAHDAFRDRSPGVLRAWRDVIEASGDYTPTRRCRSIAYAQRL